MMAWIKFPYDTEAFPTVSESDVKSIWPRISPRSGVMISWFNDVTMAVKAVPTMMPTAMLITLPLEINSLNSLKKAFM